MKLNAVAVTTTNLLKTVEFYSMLGFKFPEFKADEQHLEPIGPTGSARLMIDSQDMIKSILGYEPKPGNHSAFAIEYDNPKEIDGIVGNLSVAGFQIVKQPWDAVWGQHYAVVADPDGYMVDLYCPLKV